MAKTFIDEAVPLPGLPGALRSDRAVDPGPTLLRTRESGRHRFVSLKVLVPGSWTVERGHSMADDVEKAISLDLPDTDVQTHLEPKQRQ